jgi:hypothetical protein
MRRAAKGMLQWPKLSSLWWWVAQQQDDTQFAVAKCAKLSMPLHLCRPKSSDSGRCVSSGLNALSGQQRLLACTDPLQQQHACLLPLPQRTTHNPLRHKSLAQSI